MDGIVLQKKTERSKAKMERQKKKQQQTMRRPRTHVKQTVTIKYFSGRLLSRTTRITKQQIDTQTKMAQK